MPEIIINHVDLIMLRNDKDKWLDQTVRLWKIFAFCYPTYGGIFTLLHAW